MCSTQPSYRLICWILVTLCHLIAGLDHTSAQSIRYEIEQLPSNQELTGFSGLCIMQDRDGFMWFGSSHGLFRYDGARFRSYLYDPQNEGRGLHHELVTNLLEDEHGIIWITSLKSVTRFERETEQFKHFIPGIVAPVYFHIASGSRR